MSVREHRTAIDWAKEIKYLVDVSYPDRDRIILVMDNLNTHVLSSLYKAFSVPEARRIAKKLGIRYTPKHGSWQHGRATAISIQPVSNGSPLLIMPGLSWYLFTLDLVR